MGVPTFAVFYYLVSMFIEQKLERKKLPKESKEYEEIQYIEEKKEEE